MNSHINSMSKVIILSAHCDDIALSIGGCLIGKLFMYKPNAIITFPITNYLHNYHGSMSEEEVTILRKEEEKKIAKIINFEVKFLEFRDAFCRPNYNDYFSLFQSNSPFQDPIYSIVSKKLNKILKNYNGLICSPLAIGNHIDHKILHFYTSKLMNENPKRPLLFYEDLPYADYISNLKQKEIIDNIKKKINIRPYCFRNFDIEKKINLLKVYKSQIDKEHIKMVEHYWDSIGKGERIWITESANQYLRNEIIKMS